MARDTLRRPASVDASFDIESPPIIPFPFFSASTGVTNVFAPFFEQVVEIVTSGTGCTDETVELALWMSFVGECLMESRG